MLFETVGLAHDQAIEHLDAHIHQFRSQLLAPEGIARAHVAGVARLLGDLLVFRGWTWIEQSHANAGVAALVGPALGVLSPDGRLAIALETTIEDCICNLDASLADHFATYALAALPDPPSLHWFDIREPRPPQPPGERFGEQLVTVLT